MTLLFVLCQFMAAINFGEISNIQAVAYVDPFIGVDCGGNVFPGASLPFGMVKLGPDCDDLKANSGYKSEGNIQGFSHVHVSGTGGGPKYGNILLMPVAGDPDLRDFSSGRGEEKAEPGYYSAYLSRYHILAELSVTQKAGFHKYHFETDQQPGIIFDMGSFLTSPYCDSCDESQKLVGSEISIINDTIIEGYTRVRHGWNIGPAYTVYFSAILSQPMVTAELLRDGVVMKGAKYLSDTGEGAGAFLAFDELKDNTLFVKVGISFKGTGSARENAMESMPCSAFAEVRKQASELWNKKLSVLGLESSSEELKTICYSALYHALLQPVDRTGENPLWLSGEPYYDDFYAIWDTYRATHPLFTILYPQKQAEMIRSLVDIYEHEGFMPDARSGNASGRTQGGSNCDVLIADAWVKHLQGIDYGKALRAMMQNAESDPGADAQFKGRGGIPDYNTLGYVSTDFERAGTRTVEYAYNDFCIATLLKGMGNDSLFNKYYMRSQNWKNLWKPVSHDGARGFIMPRAHDGSWDEDYMGRSWDPETGWFDVRFSPTSGGSWPDFFYEANSWEYSLYVPQDVAQLIHSCGGEEAFIARLDTFFSRPYFNIGNEPSFLTPCLYNYVGKPWKTSEILRSTIKSRYHATRCGLPGNDDSGSMSAWVIFHAMGFFPVAGQDVYLITSPLFDKVSISLENGRQFNIMVKNLSEENIYIVSATLNGKEFKQSWFRHSDIAEGGTLVLNMGMKPGSWGTEILPPSGMEIFDPSYPGRE